MAVAVLAVLISVALTVLASFSKQDDLAGSPIDVPAPEIALTAHDGTPFLLSEQEGKVLLITFGFTYCPNICPMALGSLAAVYRELTPTEREQVQVVFVTVDPDRDTVEKLAGYVPFFHEDFIGLTGSAEEIAEVAKPYGVFYEAAPNSGDDAANAYTINHSAYTYLIGRDGTWSRNFDHDTMSHTDDVVTAVRAVLAEQS